MRRSLIALPIALAAVFATGPAQAGSQTDRATGGGQFLFTTGAGNTIGFTAQGTATAAKGQVQIVERTGGTGQGQTTFHGIVDCIQAEGTIAEIIGHARGDEGDLFSAYVMDNGEGKGVNAGTDMILFDETSNDPTCDIEDEDDDGAVALGRGNAQVYDADA